jgi:hypothetical protein
MHKQFVLFVLLTVFTMSASVHAEENTTYPMQPVTVQSTAESQELIGPYKQPRWSARGRFSTDTEVYVLPPGLFYIDLDYQGTIARHGKNVHLFTQEFEVGLPYRFQLAFENNIEIRDGHRQLTYETIEARYALADWGKIPLNPTLFAEYKFGVGKDYERQEDTDDPVPHIPDAFELRLLLGEQFGKNFQWALNIFHEQELGGDREWETGFSQALAYAIHEDYLKAGVEMQYIRQTDKDSRSHPQNEFDIGPSFTWKPGKKTRLDIAALFGTTADSPRAKLFTIFSIAFGEGKEEAEIEAPASIRNR